MSPDSGVDRELAAMLRYVFFAYPNEVKESRNQKVNLRVNGGGDFLFDICDRFALRRKASTFANFVFCHAFDQ